ncbi:MAG: pectinesterase family protein [Cyclobacteriaceae bacterium]
MRTVLSIALVFISVTIATAQGYDFVVAQDDTGDFELVQDAIDAVPYLRKNRTRILIKEGQYKEKLMIASTKTNISFYGEGTGKTILTYDDYASKLNQFGENIGTSGSSSIYIYGDGFEARDITFENSFGVGSQAVAVRVDGDKVKFENCRFLGNQDTLYPHGKESRQYYKNCYIEGTVDFIFGWSTAYFDECEIYCKGKGYITAASTEQGSEYGFVFNNCKIEGSAEVGSVFLGRPWRPYAHTVFINCKLGEIIQPDGWNPWGSEDKKTTSRYAEYNNSGAGYQPDKRVDWVDILTAEQAEKYTIENVLGDWNPNK